MRDLAFLVRNAREQAHLTRQELADKLGISKRTIDNWESGVSRPIADSLLDVYEACNAEIAKAIITADSYDAESDIEVVRQRVITYLRTIADDDMIRQLDYNLLSSHGSIAKAQVNLCTAYNHFNKDDKYDVCRTIIGKYKLKQDLGKLINMGEPLPDIEYLEKVCHDVREELIRNESRNI